jgi:hypothetical protein
LAEIILIHSPQNLLFPAGGGVDPSGRGAGLLIGARLKIYLAVVEVVGTGEDVGGLDVVGAGADVTGGAAVVVTGGAAVVVAGAAVVDAGAVEDGVGAGWLQATTLKIMDKTSSRLISISDLFITIDLSSSLVIQVLPEMKTRL